MMATKICPVCKSEYEGGEVFCPLDGARVVTHTQMESGDIPDDPLIGQMLDKYKVIRQIGEGGMGVVYSAMDTRLEKQVAIKVLKEDFAHRTDVVARFTQEAKSAARIKHENVLDVTDYGGTEDGSFYIAMELLVGTDLADVLAKEGAVELHRALNVAIQVTRALGAAHGKGIVHRDLKPENVFLVRADDGREVVKIVDFGIAQMKDMTGQGGKKLTQTGMIFGTPEYMSPEQAKGASIDHRVDIYAVGVILYEMAAGRTPFVGDSFMGILTQHLYEDPPPLAEVNPHVECSAELEMVIYKALAKAPEDRYQDMPELLEALEEASEGRIAKSTLAGYGEPVKAQRKPPRSLAPGRAVAPVAAPERSKLPMILAIVTVLALGGGTAAWFISQRPVVVAETPRREHAARRGARGRGRAAPGGGRARDGRGRGRWRRGPGHDHRARGDTPRGRQRAGGQHAANLRPHARARWRSSRGCPSCCRRVTASLWVTSRSRPRGPAPPCKWPWCGAPARAARPTTMGTTETGSDTRMTDGQTSTMMSGDLKVPDIFR
jgi:tRNA A-37 threonylcarbamoyl transferase component Bud32